MVRGHFHTWGENLLLKRLAPWSNEPVRDMGGGRARDDA